MTTKPRKWSMMGLGMLIGLILGSIFGFIIAISTDNLMFLAFGPSVGLPIGMSIGMMADKGT